MKPVVMYIDPGTGSMLFSLAIAIATTLVFGLRRLAVKLSFAISAGKTEKKITKKKPYVVYCENKRYWNVFKSICDEFENREIDVEYYTQSEDDPVFEEKYQFVKPTFIGEGNKGIAKLNFLSANIVLSTTPGLDVLQWKRSKDVDKYIHIPHGMGSMAGYRMFALDHYDAVLTNCENQNRVQRELEKVRKLPAKDLVLVGCTYLDEASKKVSKMEDYKGVDYNNITVVLAPTWGPSGLLARYEDKLIKALVDTGFNIIVRPHPQSYTSDKDLISRLEKEFEGVENLEWNQDDNNLEVLNRADIMITDFSGVVYDFAFLMNRPVIMTDDEVDTLIYDYDWLDKSVWHYKELDDLGDWFDESYLNDMKGRIVSILNSDERQEARQTAKKSLWVHQGEAAARVVDYMIDSFYKISEETHI